MLNGTVATAKLKREDLGKSGRKCWEAQEGSVGEHSLCPVLLTGWWWGDAKQGVESPPSLQLPL